MRFDHLDQTTKSILGSYDEFIGMLADVEVRTRLEGLTEEDAETDQVYQRARALSHQFRDGLLTFFFDPDSGLETLTKTYGVF